MVIDLLKKYTMQRFLGATRGEKCLASGLFFSQEGLCAMEWANSFVL